MKQWLLLKLAVLYGKRFSLNRYLEKYNAVAIIHFIEGEDKERGSIRVQAGGITYFFEGKPKIEKYKNREGKNVIKKTLKYGGWEVDMKHPDNKIPFLNNKQ